MKLSERDEHILFFLWRWKVVSTHALAKKFYSNSTLFAAYMRLWKLERGGFIEAISSTNQRGSVWCLKKNGFRTIRDQLPCLREEGYKTENIGHDIIVTAAHIGEWLVDIPYDVTFFSEQQLRRIDLESYPNWVPQTDVHRPDGYWRIPTNEGDRLVALEVELSQKKLDVYENIGRFYEEDIDVDQVIWIVSDQSLGKRIHNRFLNSSERRSNIHSFISLTQFTLIQWQASIFIGKNMGQTFDQSLENNSKMTRKHVYGPTFFDMRKNPKISAPHKDYCRHNFFNCVAPYHDF